MQRIPFRLQRYGTLTLLMAVVIALGLGSLQTAQAAVDTDPRRAMQEKWGIEVVSVRTSAAGSMVDFRYKVLDADKAEALFVRHTKPYLIHQTSGKVLSVPVTAKVGPLRSSNKPKQDRIYWMFFGNKTKLVQPGDKITVTIGQFKVENLTVE